MFAAVPAVPALLALLASVALVGACAAPDPRADGDRSGAAPSVVLRGNWNVHAATSTTVIGFAPYAPPPPDRPIVGSAVDVDSGAQMDVIAPTDHANPYLVVQDAVGTDRSVIVSGVRCPTFEVDEATECTGPVSYAWTPDGDWTRLDLPPGYERLTDVLTDLFGSPYAVAQRSGDEPTELLELDGTTWKGVGRFPSAHDLKACISSDVAYSLARNQPPGSPDQAADSVPAVSEVHALSLSDGAPTSVATPPLHGANGGVGVDLGCGPSGPVVATQTSDRGPIATHRLVAGAWEAVSPTLAGGAPAMLGEALSTPVGVAFLYVLDGPGEPPTDKIVNLDLVREAGTATFTENTVDRQVVLMGASDRVAYVPIDGSSRTPLSLRSLR